MTDTIECRECVVAIHSMLVATTAQSAILHALRDAGIPIPFSAAEGIYNEPEERAMERVRKGLFAIRCSKLGMEIDHEGNRIYRWK